ncbi:MAG: hypothetical protein M3355_11835 [Actinomycetota bacterium]|nr:hypothetical protein [Actinomycetota bacterium]
MSGQAEDSPVPIRPREGTTLTIEVGAARKRRIERRAALNQRTVSGELRWLIDAHTLDDEPDDDPVAA